MPIFNHKINDVNEVPFDTSSYETRVRIGRPYSPKNINVHPSEDERLNTGRSISNVVAKAYALTNIDHSPDHFSFDPAEQFKTVKDARSKGLEILTNFHSHPSTPARPSDEDIRLAYDPNISYVIISLANSKPDVKSFKIKDGKVEHEEIKIIE